MKLTAGKHFMSEYEHGLGVNLKLLTHQCSTWKT